MTTCSATDWWVEKEPPDLEIRPRFVPRLLMSEFELDASSLIRKSDGGPVEKEGLALDAEPSKLFACITGTCTLKFDCNWLLASVISCNVARFWFKRRSDDWWVSKFPVLPVFDKLLSLLLLGSDTPRVENDWDVGSHDTFVWMIFGDDRLAALLILLGVLVLLKSVLSCTFPFNSMKELSFGADAAAKPLICKISAD